MIGIRADMNRVIATGHIMRCLSIAEELRKKDQKVLFLTADGQASELLERRGFQYCVLGTKWDELDAEFPILKDVIQKNNISKLLVDSYYVTPSYLRQLCSIAEITYLDDLHAFDYPVHKLICYAGYWRELYNQQDEVFPGCGENAGYGENTGYGENAGYGENTGYGEYAVCGKKGGRGSVKCYMGPSYAPLRSVFKDCGGHEIKPEAERLLMLSGGIDRYQVLGQILERLDLAQYRRIDVICGLYDDRYEILKCRYKDHANVVLHQAVTDIETYMQEADLAVSAGGSTLYELCACGTPAISYSLADNQLHNVRKFDADQMIEYAGDVRYDPAAEQIVCCLERYRTDWEERKRRSVKMQQLVDGRGAERIAEALSEI